jgi:hypothetical protein
MLENHKFPLRKILTKMWQGFPLGEPTATVGLGASNEKDHHTHGGCNNGVRLADGRSCSRPGSRSGRRPGSGRRIGGIIGVAMGTILEQLSQAEQNNRQQALQKAARGKSAAWSSSGKNGKKARYVNKGTVASADGKKCSKIQETITLPDGKQGTSVETVCFSA